MYYIIILALLILGCTGPESPQILDPSSELPDTIILVGPNDRETVTISNIIFKWQGNHGFVTQFRFRIDGDNWSAWGTQDNVSLQLDEGIHIFEVVGRISPEGDRSGTEDPTPAIRQFTVLIPIKISFEDEHLEAVVREAIAKQTGDILSSDVASLMSLNATGKNIVSLEGLENLVSLRILQLGGNRITDLSPLSKLPSLTQLQIWGNQITDLSPLSNLTSLTLLSLIDNEIIDLSPLSNLTSLTSLYLSGNKISSISPLSALTSLQNLQLNINSITDISTLSGLTSLNFVELKSNNINDIRALVSNSGLDSGDEIALYGNPLSAEAILRQIPLLEARKVLVKFIATLPKEYRDDFNDAVFDGWKVIKGNWSAAMGELVGIGDGTILLDATAGLINYTLTLSVRYVSGFGYRIIFRHNSAGDPSIAGDDLFYTFSYDVEANTLYLEGNNAGGVLQQLKPFTFDDEWHRVKITVQGSRLEVFFDNFIRPILTVENTKLPLGGIGFSIWGSGFVESHFDDVTVIVP